GFPERPETLVTERSTVDVAEDHDAAKLELLHGAAKFSDRRGRITERQRGESNEAATLRGDDASEGVIHQAGKADGGRRLFYMRARRGESDDLGIDAGVTQDLLAVVDVTMAGDCDVVVAGIMQARISRGIVRDADRAWSLFNGLDVLRRVVVIMKVDRGHSCSVLWVQA